MKIVFCGDLFLGGDALHQEIRIDSDIFHDAAIRVVNLEQAVSDSEHKADKSTLYTSSKVLPWLQKNNIDLINIANNHIQDKGVEGIAETWQHLKSMGAEPFGGGKDITQAQRPVKIDDRLYILGYCDFDRPYLKQVVIADQKNPGVNPLRKEKVLKDLESLPKGARAVLYFHWGIEHVDYPPQENASLARELLKDERVALIIGIHSHRTQGYHKQDGKYAYYGIGNFLFPNFVIDPPTQCSESSADEAVLVTYQYHSVLKKTYKKWRLINRVSQMVVLNTEDDSVSHIYMKQHRNRPWLKEVKGPLLRWFKLREKYLNLIMRSTLLFRLVFKINHGFSAWRWRLGIYFFRFRESGFYYLFDRLFRRNKKK